MVIFTHQLVPTRAQHNVWDWVKVTDVNIIEIIFITIRAKLDENNNLYFIT